MKRAGVASTGGIALAFLTSQHHNLHTLLLALGLGGAGMTLMQSFPDLRRAMLLLSLAMVAVSLSSLRHHAAAGRRTLILASAVVTIGLVAWSVLRLGF